MTIRNRLFLSALSVTLVATGAAMQPAFAQAAQAGIAAGAQVKDTNGGDVGTVTKVDGQFVVLKTDRHEVRLPVASFTAHQGHFLMALTRDQLNAEVDKTKAAADAKLVAGAAVAGSQGGNVGTIDAIDAQFVTVKLASGKLVRLPRAAVAPGPNGGVIGMTVAELEAAAAQATGGAPAEAGAAADAGAEAKAEAMPKAETKPKAAAKPKTGAKPR
jgi:preprotein translocase subunit YajC